MDFRIELVPVPVTDVDRAIAFYTEQMGFDLDHDHTVSDDLRFVQLTPPGSACSITVGVGITEMAPGTQQIQMVVEDIEAARQELVSRGRRSEESTLSHGATSCGSTIPTATDGRSSTSDPTPIGSEGRHPKGKRLWRGWLLRVRKRADRSTLLIQRQMKGLLAS